MNPKKEAEPYRPFGHPNRSPQGGARGSLHSCPRLRMTKQKGSLRSIVASFRRQFFFPPFAWGQECPRSVSPCASAVLPRMPLPPWRDRHPESPQGATIRPSNS